MEVKTALQVVHVTEAQALLVTQYLCPFVSVSWTMPGLFQPSSKGCCYILFLCS